MKIPFIHTGHLLKDTDVSARELLSLFEFARSLKQDLIRGKKHAYLEGKTLGMIFEKSSTRTRVSFEVGMYQLGGHALFLSSNDIQLGRGESVADTAKVLSRYLDGIMIRTFEQSKVDEIAANGTVPVINGLTDMFHPCQAYTDYFTMYERNKNLNGIKLAFIGDGNNMVNSLMLTGALLGVNVSIASPKGYLPDARIIEEARTIAIKSGSQIIVGTDIETAAENADYLYTDVWTSMGKEKESLKRKKAFSKYKITMGLVKKCCPDARIMHCLPAHRGEEVDQFILDSPNSIIFDQAENRMHMQKALLCGLLSKKTTRRK